MDVDRLSRTYWSPVIIFTPNYEFDTYKDMYYLKLRPTR